MREHVGLGDALRAVRQMWSDNSMSAKDRRILHQVGTELRDNPPRQLSKTRKNSGAKRANKQRVAILLSKARSKGAKV